jgi:excisionase family DNA binding protein
MEKVYTLEELAKELQLNIKTVQKYVREGTIKAFKIGRVWRVTETDLQEFWKSLPTSRDNK